MGCGIFVRECRELDFIMTVLRRLALFGLLLTVATPHARAQSVALSNGNALVLYGLTFKISGCTANCSGLDLQGVPDGRGNIEYEVVSSAGAGSAALSRNINTGSSGSTTLSFTITVSATSGQPNTLVTSAALMDSGIQSFTCASGYSSCASGTTAGATLTSFSGVTMTPSTVSQALTLNQSALQTTALSTKSTDTGDNSFYYLETLTLSSNGSTQYVAGSTLQLNTVATVFRAAPEPASMTVLMVALGGLAVARRRRGASSGNPTSA